jgi:hypothetical protein
MEIVKKIIIKKKNSEMKWANGDSLTCVHFEQKAAYIGLKVGHSIDNQY